MLISRRRVVVPKRYPRHRARKNSKSYAMSGNDSDIHSDIHRGPPLVADTTAPTPGSLPSNNATVNQQQNDSVVERTQLLHKFSSVLSLDSNQSEEDSVLCVDKNSMWASSRDNRAEPWMQRTWIAHFIIGAAVLLYSVWTNGGSKYIPVDPSRSSRVSGMEELKECHKLFVNIMAVSRDEPDAVVCCTMDSGGDGLADTLFALCPPYSNNETPLPTYLPFLGRLAKFPDAWLIPLFPLLLRIAFRTYQTVLENGHFVLDTTFGVYSFRRLVFYFMLMQFRGWVLYVALNGIEDYLSTTSKPQEEGGPPCWYQEWLHDSQSRCCGRTFDFSDHVVLYYAQLLPIALLEYIHSIHRPYWPFHCFRRVALPFLLSLGMLYLYFITFVGVFKTAAYFHTSSESLAGYAVSLLAHLPLCVFQCSNGFELLFTFRDFFFGPKTKMLLQ